MRNYFKNFLIVITLILTLTSFCWSQTLIITKNNQNYYLNKIIIKKADYRDVIIEKKSNENNEHKKEAEIWTIRVYKNGKIKLLDNGKARITANSTKKIGKNYKYYSSSCSAGFEYKNYNFTNNKDSQELNNQEVSQKIYNVVWNK